MDCNVSLIKLMVLQMLECSFNQHYGKKGVKWDINYKFSQKTTMTIAAETVLREDVIGKV
jgi:hypothetical protein